MNKRELLEQANSYYQSNDKKEALTIYLMIVELYPHAYESNISQQNINKIVKELSLNENDLNKYRDKTKRRAESKLSNNSLIIHLKIIIGFLLIITLLMLKQTFINPSYSICVTSIGGDPNPPLVCQGDFQGERTVSEMYENGWKLITNVGTSVPTWLFEK